MISTLVGGCSCRFLCEMLLHEPLGDSPQRQMLPSADAGAQQVVAEASPAGTPCGVTAAVLQLELEDSRAAALAGEETTDRYY
jgi:hypothetical protein